MMSIRSYLFSLYSSTLFALAVWLSILFYSNPETADIVTMIAFFASFFLWLSGFLTFIVFHIKLHLSHYELIHTHISSSIRQATLISATITSLVILRAIQTLEWWTAVLVVIIFILLELSLRSRYDLNDWLDKQESPI